MSFHVAWICRAPWSTANWCSSSRRYAGSRNLVAANGQAQVIADLAVTAYVGLPSYLPVLEGEVIDGQGLSEDRFVDICDPETGEAILDDTPGEVVTTALVGGGLVRFGTGEVSRWQLGDHGLVLAGVLGRVGAAVKVRGMFVHPHQAAAGRYRRH